MALVAFDLMANSPRFIRSFYCNGIRRDIILILLFHLRKTVSHISKYNLIRRRSGLYFIFNIYMGGIYRGILKKKIIQYFFEFLIDSNFFENTKSDLMNFLYNLIFLDYFIIKVQNLN